MGPKPRAKRKPFRVLFRLVFLWIVIHLAYVTIDGLYEYKGHADIAVVLGNTVKADSSLSPVLQGRVEKALQLYRQGRVQKIMVSGGKGLEGANVPEGMAMKRYLVKKGVPPGRIIEDNDGENTYFTAKDYKAVSDSLHYTSVIAVSSFYHITRCKYIFRKLGIKNVHGASSDVYFTNDLVGLLREFPAFYKYVFWY